MHQGFYEKPFASGRKTTIKEKSKIAKTKFIILYWSSQVSLGNTYTKPS